MRPPPDAYVLAHVSGLLPNERQRQLMVILQACIDDSASNRRHGPGYFMLGGLIATVDQWVQFSIEWQAKLDEAPALDYFKFSEASAMKGQFHTDRGWTEKLRDTRVRDLAKIAREHSLLGVSCFMPQHDYDEFIKCFAPNKELQDPYFMCFYQIVDAVTEARAHLPSDELQYIFDDQGETGLRAVSYWNDYRTSLPWYRPDLLGSTPKHENDKKFRPLQAADLYAGLRRTLQGKGREITPQIESWAEPFDGMLLLERGYTRESLMLHGAHLVVKNSIG